MVASLISRNIPSPFKGLLVFYSLLAVLGALFGTVVSALLTVLPQWRTLTASLFTVFAVVVCAAFVFRDVQFDLRRQKTGQKQNPSLETAVPDLIVEVGGLARLVEQLLVRQADFARKTAIAVSDEKLQSMDLKLEIITNRIIAKLGTLEELRAESERISSSLSQIHASIKSLEAKFDVVLKQREEHRTPKQQNLALELLRSGPPAVIREKLAYDLDQLLAWHENPFPHLAPRILFLAFGARALHANISEWNEPPHVSSIWNLQAERWAGASELFGARGYYWNREVSQRFAKLFQDWSVERSLDPQSAWQLGALLASLIIEGDPEKALSALYMRIRDIGMPR